MALLLNVMYNACTGYLPEGIDLFTVAVSGPQGLPW